MIIHPDINNTPDRPVISFRTPKELMDLILELARAMKSQGWALGTRFTVQFVNHERTQLLSTAEFVVSDREESFITNDDNPYAPTSKDIVTYRAMQVGEWWYSETGAEIRDTPEPEPEVFKLKLAYDNTRKLHQVVFGTEIMFENQFKGKCQEYIREQRA